MSTAMAYMPLIIIIQIAQKVHQMQSLLSLQQLTGHLNIS